MDSDFQRLFGPAVAVVWPSAAMRGLRPVHRPYSGSKVPVMGMGIISWRPQRLFFGTKACGLCRRDESLMVAVPQSQRESASEGKADMTRPTMRAYLASHLHRRRLVASSTGWFATASHDPVTLGAREARAGHFGGLRPAGGWTPDFGRAGPWAGGASRRASAC